jgi:hypothetical protein
MVAAVLEILSLACLIVGAALVAPALGFLAAGASGLWLARALAGRADA